MTKRSLASNDITAFSGRPYVRNEGRTGYAILSSIGNIWYTNFLGRATKVVPYHILSVDRAHWPLASPVAQATEIEWAYEVVPPNPKHDVHHVFSEVVPILLKQEQSTLSEYKKLLMYEWVKIELISICFMIGALFFLILIGEANHIENIIPVSSLFRIGQYDFLCFQRPFLL